MKEIKGNVRRFLSINTTEYNSDGEYLVLDLDYSELESYGWIPSNEYCIYNGKKSIKIDNLGVGGIIVAEEEGAYLMRIA